MIQKGGKQALIAPVTAHVSRCWRLALLLSIVMVMHGTLCHGVSFSPWRQAHPLQLGETLRGIAFGNGLFVAVGKWGAIRTSTDAIHWTYRSSSTTEELIDVVWAGSQFVVVGEESALLTSPDGITWTRHTSLTVESVTKLVWTGSRLVLSAAVGNQAVVLTSPDAASWIESRPTDVTLIYGIGWTDSQLVASALVAGEYRFMTSVDGTSWTVQGLAGGYFRDFAWNGSILVAIRDNNYATSLDGISWTTRTRDDDDFVTSLVWDGTQFIATGTVRSVQQTSSILTSPDGTTWSRYVLYVDRNLYGLVATHELVVAVGLWGCVLSSPDGAYWRVEDQGINSTLQAVAWSGERFVAVGDEGLVLISSDGLSWQRVDLGIASDLYDVTFADSRFIAVGRDGQILFANATADLWQEGAAPTLSALFGVTWTGTKFMACGSHGTLLTSSDGGSWSLHHLGTSRAMFDLLWTGDRYILADYVYGFMVSEDSILWEPVTFDYPDYPFFRTVASSGSLLVAAGDYEEYGRSRGQVHSSLDGLEWTPRGDSLGSSLHDVIWAGDRFLAVGSPEYLGHDAIFVSPDGLTWSADPRCPKNISLNGAAFAGSQIIAVGADGAIFISGWLDLFTDGFESGDTTAWSVSIQ